MKIIFVFFLFFFLIPFVFAQSDNNITELNEKASVLISKDQFKEALSISEQILSTESKNFDALYNKAVSLFGLQRYLESVETYEFILANNDIVTNKILYNYGASLSKIERYDDAIQYFDFIDSQDDLFISALNQKAYALIKLEKFEQAITVLDTIIRLEENNVQALTNKANVLSKLGSHDEALTIINSVIDKNSTNVLALINKAIIFHDKGEPIVALNILNNALSIQPNNTLALHEKTIILFELGRYSETDLILEQLLEINPYDQDAINKKGSIFFVQGKYEDALTFFDRALELDSQNTLILQNKFLSLVNLNRNTEAFQVVNEILFLEPNNSIALKNKDVLIDEIETDLKERDQQIQIATNIIIFSAIGIFILISIFVLRKLPKSVSSAKFDIIILLPIWWTIVFLIILFIGIREDMSFYTSSGDLQNWVTFIASIGLGSTIAISIFLLSHIKQKELDEKIDNLETIQMKMDEVIIKSNKILAKHDVDVERRKKLVKSRLDYELTRTNEWVSRMNGIIDNYEQHKNDENVVSNFKENTLHWLKTPYSIRNESVRVLENLVEFYSEIFDDVQIKKIKKLIDVSKSFHIPGTEHDSGKPIIFRSEGTDVISNLVSELRSTLHDLED